VREATSLRERGADIVLVTAHAGGICQAFDDPRDLSSCESDQEIFEVAAALPEGTVDAIVAGHTHRAVAHYVAGIPIIESYSYGAAFGRIDLVVEEGRVIESTVHPPQHLCASGACGAECVLSEYEGQEVTMDQEVADLITPAIAGAAEVRERRLGVELASAVTATRTHECPLGNLFTDLMRASRDDVDVALTNGGGLRADLPAGPLTYGSLYEASPFDNRFALVRLTGAELAQLVAENLRHDGSFFSLSGVEVSASCDEGELRVVLRDERGRPVRDDARLTLITTDFLATSGDGLFAHVSGDNAITVEDGEIVRDAMARVLEARGGTLDPTALYDPSDARVRFVGERPVHCEH
jgi:5'-nucleotidase